MRIKGMFVTAAVALMAAHAISENSSSATSAPVETFSLVHAIGNSERVVVSGIDKYECQSRKKEYAKVVLYAGAGGSVTCIPDKLD